MNQHLYRYRTIETSGSIEIADDVVRCSVRGGAGAFEQETPLSRVLPYPTQSTQLTTTFWACILVGIAGVVCGIWGILDNAGTHMAMAWAIPLFVASLGMVVFALRNRSETWVWYPTEIDGHCVLYCKSRGDDETFNEFSEILSRKIASSRSSE